MKLPPNLGEVLARVQGERRTFYFGATEDVANILAGVDKKDRSDFINQCIIKAMGRG